jgi:hypothetical protein
MHVCKYGDTDVDETMRSNVIWMPQKNNKFIYHYLSVPILQYKALPFIVLTLEAFDAMQPYTTSKLNITLLIARNTVFLALSYYYTGRCY